MQPMGEGDENNSMVATQLPAMQQQAAQQKGKRPPEELAVQGCSKRTKLAPEAAATSELKVQEQAIADDAAAGNPAAAPGAPPAAGPPAPEDPAAEAAKQQRGAAAAEAAAQAEALRLQLVEAAAQFVEECTQRQLFLEVDLAKRLGQYEMVGRHVRVYWQDDDAWYLGTIAGYDLNTGEHTIEYADGDREQVVVALERTRLLMHAGEQLPTPDHGSLFHYAEKLRQLAGMKKWQGQQAAVLRRRANDLEALARQLQPEQEEQERLRMLEEKAQLAAGPALQQQQSLQAPQAEGQHPQDGHESARQPAEQLAALGSGCTGDGDHAAEGAGMMLSGGNAGTPEGGGAAAAAAAPPEGAAGARQAALRPGDVGWFQVKGYPHWPFMVITREEALAQGIKEFALDRPGYLPVQYFGNGEVQSINPAAVEKGGGGGRRGGSGKGGGKGGSKPCFATFLDGLERGYHSIGRCKKYMQFRKALFDVVAYFKTGELPLCMLPQHNDGHGAEAEEDDEDELEAAAVQAQPSKPAPKRRKGGKAAQSAAQPAAAEGAAALDARKLPMRVNQSLEVLALGEVEWLHPAFHNANCIYPVGYRARRTTQTPASGKQMLPHLMEILRAPDGSGPLFRVTPEGRPPVEGRSATHVWKALYAGDAAGQARTVNIIGDHMYGFSSPKVLRAIEALPGAQRCDKYCGWPGGEQPEVPPLSAKELRERLACEARMQKLPDSVAGVPVKPSAAGVCHVCNEEDEDDEDLVVQCNRCHVFVHMSCYSIKQPPNGSLWLCDVCSLGMRQPPPCVLCPVLGGALKRTSCGRWAHPTCALWLPEPYLDGEESYQHLRGVVQNVQNVHHSRFKLTCQVCQQRHGACMQCCEPKCYAGFHPLCARQAGYKMEMVIESDGEEEEEEEEAQAAHDGLPQQAQQAHAGDTAGPAAAAAAPQQAGQHSAAQREASCEVSGAGVPPSSAPGCRQQAGGSGGGGGGKKKAHKRRAEGTQRGNVRLLAFCPKHGPPAAPPAAAGAALGGSLHSGAGEEAAALSRQQSANGPAAAAASLAQQQQQQQPQAPPAHPWGSARAVPFNHGARRGQRAPEAVAAAQAKRGFVRSIPYLVGGPLQQGWAEVPASRCRRLPRLPAAAPTSEGVPADPAGAGAALAATDVQQEQQQPPPPQQQQQQQPQAREPLPAAEAAAAAAPLRPRAGGDEQPPWSPRDGLALAGGAAGTAAAALALPTSPPAGQERLLMSPSRNLKSDSVRYQEMLATHGQRVTIGKSGIHGWGAFAKRAHAAHDMVIEYVGELVRQSVLNLRERRLYNDILGQGTYTFTMNNKHCVDATRAGNLAHMLNHSCNFNCFSRTIRVMDSEGRMEEKVIIFAARDIAVGEELTYDYRFSGKETLPCNCGAPNCRGLVNQKAPEQGPLVVPRSQAKRYRPPRQAQQARRPPSAQQRQQQQQGQPRQGIEEQQEQAGKEQEQQQEPLAKQQQQQEQQAEERPAEQQQLAQGQREGLAEQPCSLQQPQLQPS